MSSESDRDFAAILFLPILGLACCVGIPLLLSVGAGAALWVIGAGVPLAVAVLIVGLLIQRSRRRRAAARSVARRSGSSPASGPLRSTRSDAPEGGSVG